MSSVGETLRRERVRRKLSLEQIANEIKISTRFLEAIENEQFDRLPGGVFARSFVRQYARILGLDEEELAGEVQRSQDIEESPVFQPSVAQPSFKVPKLTNWEGGAASRTSSPWSALALVVVMMLVCAGVYAWWQSIRRPSPPPATNPTVASTPVPKALHAAEPAHVLPAVAQKIESPATAEGAPPATDRPAAGTATLHVSLSADTPTWVRVWADGKEVMTATLQPNETKTVDAVDGIRLRTGNAGDLHVTLNGKAVGPLGPKGQIRVVQLTTQGVQIDLPPKPESPAAPPPEPL
jgi:cytoskeleton protein RodZ